MVKVIFGLYHLSFIVFGFFLKVVDPTSKPPTWIYHLSFVCFRFVQVVDFIKIFPGGRFHFKVFLFGGGVTFANESTRREVTTKIST